MTTSTIPHSPAKAAIQIDGNTVTLPVVRGSEGELAIDIRRLRDATGMITAAPTPVHESARASTT